MGEERRSLAPAAQKNKQTKEKKNTTQTTKKNKNTSPDVVEKRDVSS